MLDSSVPFIISYFTEDIFLQDFNVEALEKFVEESSIPLVTLFNSDPSNHPFVIKFYNSPNAKVNYTIRYFIIFITLLNTVKEIRVWLAFIW